MIRYRTLGPEGRSRWRSGDHSRRLVGRPRLAQHYRNIRPKIPLAMRGRSTDQLKFPAPLLQHVHRNQQIAGTATSGEVRRMRRRPSWRPSGSSVTAGTFGATRGTSAGLWMGPGNTSTARTLSGDVVGRPSSDSRLSIVFWSNVVVPRGSRLRPSDEIAPAGCGGISTCAN